MKRMRLKNTKPVRKQITYSRRSIKLERGEHEKVKHPSLWSRGSIIMFFRDSLKFLNDANDKHLFFKQICHRHDVYQNHINAWKGKDKEYATYLNKIKEAEETKIALCSITKKINPGISKLYLQTQHDWIEHNKTDIIGAIMIQTDIKDLTV